MKKVLLVSNMYPSKEFPHYGVFVQNCERLLSKNYEVKKAVVSKSNHKFLKLFRYVLFYISAIYYSLFFNFDVIYVNYIAHSGYFLKAFLFFSKHTKVISNIHGNDFIYETEKDKKFENIGYYCLEKSDIIIVPSHYFESEVSKKYPLFSSKIRVFPSGGVDTQLFHPRTNKPRELKIDHHIKLGFVSRIEIDKGWDTAIEIVDRLIKKGIDADLYLGGNGDQMGMLTSKIEELRLESKVHLVGYLTQAEMNVFFNDIDIFVFPTRRKSESLGLVALEAMASGSIVLASNCYGPSTYVIDGENGYTFDPHDVNSAVEKIDQIFNEEASHIDQVRRCAFETAQKYDNKRIESILSDIFLEVLNENR